MNGSSKPESPESRVAKLIANPIDLPCFGSSEEQTPPRPPVMSYEWFLRTSEAYLPASNRVRDTLYPLDPNPVVFKL